jgi:hypothetical protein
MAFAMQGLGEFDSLARKSDNLIIMKVSLTEFQRNFRKAREAADSGDVVIVKGEHGDYLFERRTVASDHPFAGLEGVFGAISLGPRSKSLREQVRNRLAKNHHRRRGTA